MAGFPRTNNDLFGTFTGYIGPRQTRYPKIYENMIIDDRAEKVHKVVVHTFKLGDVEDPDLYAAEPLWQWQQTEQGKWVMEHSLDAPVWHRAGDPFNYHYVFKITAQLAGKDYTFWQLKWGNLT